MPNRRILELKNCPDINPTLQHIALCLIARYAKQEEVFRNTSDKTVLIYRGTEEQQRIIQRMFDIIIYRFSKHLLIETAKIYDHLDLYDNPKLIKNN